MWICRKCNAEVEDNFEICWSCGTSSDGAQDPSFRRFDKDEDVVQQQAAVAAAVSIDKLVTVATYWVAGQAHEVQCILEADGIPVFIAYDFAIAQDWFLDNAVGSIQLQVAESQVEKARKVLADHPRETTPLAPPPPAPPKPAELDEEARYKDQPWLAPVPRDLSREETLKFLEGQVSSLMDSKDVPGWKVNPAFHPDVIAFIQKNASNIGFVQKAQGLQRNRAKYFATIRAESLKPKPVEEEKPKEVKEAGPSWVSVFGRRVWKRCIVLPLRSLGRLLKWTAILLAAALFFVFIASLLYRGYGDKQLEKAVLETEEKDPDWTWEALQAKRKKVEDKDNAALVIAELAKQLPQDWPEDKRLSKFPKEARVPLTETQVELLQSEFEKYSGVLKKARNLNKLSAGRWPTSLSSEEPIGSALACAVVAELLQFDAALQAQQHRPSEALASARSILAVARSIGDDPEFLRQLARTSQSSRACGSVMRTLALVAKPAEEDLAEIQQLLESEEKEPLRIYWLRGERARIDKLMDPLKLSTEGTFLAPIEQWLRDGEVKLAKAALLREFNAVIANADKPIEEQVGLFRSLGVQLASRRASLRCAIAMIAAERYRLANGRWPESLEELVPKYLSAVPIDPIDGLPLRFNRLDDGLEIYSIGDRGLGELGAVIVADGKEVPQPRRKIAFRLWDVTRRGQEKKD
jgi:hypothetical protein